MILLRELGFKNLYGIDVNNYAVELAKERAEGIQIIFGSALDIPFKDKSFDLIFTWGLLIHIAPSNIKRVLQEICRCTKVFILGIEYFAEEHIQVNYRGKKDLLWKANFSELYLSLFRDLEIVKKKKLAYLDSNSVDEIFLLRK